MNEEAVARAIACFDRSTDTSFLRDVLRTIRPKAEQAALRASQQGREAPPPDEIGAATEAATPEEAMETVRKTRDFPLLQAMARAAGRRAEELAQA